MLNRKEEAAGKKGDVQGEKGNVTGMETPGGKNT